MSALKGIRVRKFSRVVKRTPTLIS